MKVVMGPVPKPRFFDHVTLRAAQLSREHVEKWTGVKVRAQIVKIDRRAFKAQKKCGERHLRRRFLWGGRKWVFAWPDKLLEEFKDLGPSVFLESNPLWLDYHPFLQIRPLILEVKEKKSFWPPPVSLLWGVDNLPRLI
jgi:hypothetical protein